MARSLLLAAVVWGTLGGAVAADAEVYTLEKCIQVALENNLGLISARNSFEAARWNVVAGYGQILPGVSISADRSSSWSPLFRRIKGNYVLGAGTSVDYGGNLVVSQTYGGLGLATLASIGQRQAQRELYRYGYFEARQSLIYQVKESYFNLIKAKMLATVSADAVKRAEEQLRVVESRYELGSASLSDVLKAKVNRSNAQLEQITAENNYSLAKENLNYVMGVPVGTELEVAEDLKPVKFDMDYQAAVLEAMALNPSYRKARHDLQAAEAELLLARASFLPSLSFSMSHSTSVDEIGQLLDFKKKDASSFFSVGLSFRIFNNFSDFANLIARKKLVNTQKRAYTDAMNAVALEVKKAFLDVQQSQQKMKLAEESVASAQEDLNIVKEKYRLGAATIVEVLDAEVSFKQAQTNQVQALFDYNLAVSRLEKAIGR